MTRKVQEMVAATVIFPLWFLKQIWNPFQRHLHRCWVRTQSRDPSELWGPLSHCVFPPAWVSTQRPLPPTRSWFLPSRACSSVSPSQFVVPGCSGQKSCYHPQLRFSLAPHLHNPHPSPIIRIYPARDHFQLPPSRTFWANHQSSHVSSGIFQ